MRADWKNTDTEYLVDGEKNNFYINPAYPGVAVVSRKRRIPHSGREGYWWHTDYAVLTSAGEQTFSSLGDAIKWVEDTRVPEVPE